MLLVGKKATGKFSRLRQRVRQSESFCRTHFRSIVGERSWASFQQLLISQTPTFETADRIFKS
ncbi:MAG: hypothetical protein C4325_03520 [Blastocatellia bacterium]